MGREQLKDNLDSAVNDYSKENDCHEIRLEALLLQIVLQQKVIIEELKKIETNTRKL